MKKNTLLIVLLINFFTAFSQAPSKFNYQGVARNAQGAVISNQNITLKVSILDSIITGSSMYTETHSTKTNQLGLFNLVIGNGTVNLGTCNKINWGTNEKFIKIEMDPSGGSNFVLIGTSQLLSVPYALNAKQAENVQIKAQGSYVDDGMITTNTYQTWITSPQQIIVESDGKYLLNATGRAWSSWSAAIMMRIQNETQNTTLGITIITSVNIQGIHQGEGSFSRIVQLKKGDVLNMEYYGDAKSEWAYGGNQYGCSSMTILKVGE